WLWEGGRTLASPGPTHDLVRPEHAHAGKDQTGGHRGGPGTDRHRQGRRRVPHPEEGRARLVRRDLSVPPGEDAVVLRVAVEGRLLLLRLRRGWGRDRVPPEGREPHVPRVGRAPR